MSSLVHKQRQQVAMTTIDDKQADEGSQLAAQQPKKQQNLTPPPKKGLSQRSVSFEKLMVTAFHIRLACSKCSRESLKLCIEMLIVRWSIIAKHWIAVFLEIANVIIPKWQIRARHFVDTAIVRRREQRQQNEKRIKAAASSASVETKVDDVKQDVIAEEEERSDAVEENVIPRRRYDGESRLTEEIVAAVDQQEEKRRKMRRGLAIAVAGCIVLLAAQVCIGLALLLLSSQTIPWGLLFLVGCIAYIGYLLQSICDYDLVNKTTCKYGKIPKSPQRQHTPKVVMSSNESPSSPRTTQRPPRRVIELSFIERTMSKVKLL